jgi:hypothetical protein
MLGINESVPIEYLQEIIILSAELDTCVPDKNLDKNLLITSWNMRGFGDLFDNWLAGAFPAHFRPLPFEAEFVVH